jgi:hypothetical protein
MARAKEPSVMIDMVPRLNRWRRSVIRVGDGRGFIVADGQDRLCVTAAHCLPALPPVAGTSYADGRTVSDLLGPIGSPASVAAELRFVDPIADIAVLGSPDNQELFEQAQAYEALTERLVPIPLTARALMRATHILTSGDTYLGHPQAQDDGWLLGLDGEWFLCRLEIRRSVWVSDAAKPIVGGMSGSPIVSRGGAVGLVTTSAGTGHDHDDHRKSGASPYLRNDLPGWLARRVRATRS